MNKLDFLIDWYHKENDRQSSINNSLSIPIGILSGLLALLFFLIKDYSYSNETNHIAIFVFALLIIASIICWVIVVINLFLSYNNLFKGYEYKGIPYPTILNNQYEGLEKFVEEQKDELDEKTSADSLFEQQFHEMLSEYLNRNIGNNDKKSSYLHVAKKYLLLCFIFTACSSIPFSINYFNYNDIEKVKSIEIKNLEKLNDLFKEIEIENLKIHNYERQESKKTDSTTTTASEINKGRKAATTSTKTPEKK